MTPSLHSRTIDAMTTTLSPAAAAGAKPKTLRPAGETGASPNRPAQRMHGDALAFDLPGEVAQLQCEPGWERGDRNAKTLAQEPGLRVVLVALKPGARLDDHQSHAQVTVHVLDGRLLVHLAGRTIEAFADRLVSIETGVAHELEALEASVFLLTIAGTRTGPTTPAGRSRRAARLAAGAAAAEGAHQSRAGQNWEDDGGHAADEE